MLGLIVKDLFITKKYMRTIFAILIFYTFFCTMYSSASFLSGMVILSFSMITLTTIAYDDTVKWDKYALTMPITRTDVVFAKYISTFIFTISGALISLILAYAVTIIKRVHVTNEDLLTILVVSAIGFILISIMLPLVYKFGVEKARFLLFIVFAVPFAFVLIAKSMNLPVPSDNSINLLLKLSPFIAAVIFIISFLISDMIYKNKEM